MKLILTCEHGGNHIPEDYSAYFNSFRDVLETHRGYDLGALDIFKSLEPLSDYSLFSETSRLLIELNRSLYHNHLFSEASKKLSKVEKKTLIDTYYLEYRTTVENKIEQYILNNEDAVVHLSIHSFTPILNQEERNCDIGLLYDSKKTAEKTFCSLLKKELQANAPEIKVRFNYPYLGKADGFTSYLRSVFHKRYLGIEIEINQKLALNNVMDENIKKLLFSSIKSVLNHY
ncbi:N-formylglutamate amidohydrolase [Tamlana sp. 2_MG-2023]|uniref:N-formylglutamate amidohydrolase n=1 Tax=unclassified Tamlana TaxID=2614803 RepID=UPI0026E2EB56|nr:MULTISPECIES: N-formylglutamate amidohydrolase [unclassified Tamlana]MDO6760130.1 N-formylglutamate amidohydrolase [Tamlana sp. 2_MG-2023]MDO6790172.1 N-formylglutamate amidohydrolase [Tamlana sp. 1_MG-2023]